MEVGGGKGNKTRIEMGMGRGSRGVLCRLQTGTRKKIREIEKSN
jgi:hypothetical protein